MSAPEGGSAPGGVLATRGGRRALFALLYFAEGAPIGYIWWALPTRLREAGVPIEQVTQLSALLTLPWAFKFLWAPLVDALRPRRAGLRGWITGAQLAMGATLLPVLGLDPVSGYSLLMAALLAHAFAAATQDVAIDALAVASIPASDRGAMTGWMQVGMLGGRALFGGVALAVEARVGADAVVTALVALVWLSSGLVWLAREAPAPQRGALAERTRYFGRLLSRILSQPATWLGLGIAVLAGAAMEATGAVAGPLLIDRGFEQASVGEFFALPAVLAMGAGALVGGRFSDAAPRVRALGIAIAALAVSVGVLAFAARVGGGGSWLIGALTLVYGLFGVYTACAYALFMDLTEPSLGGTQFSAYMGGVNLCAVWSAAAVGRLAGAFDYPTALAAMAAASLLALPLLAACARTRRAA